MRSRQIERCGYDCGTLRLKEGAETVFKLGFEPNSGANGITLGNPETTSSTLIKLSGPPRYELSLRALREGNSSITIRDKNGELMVHFDISVVK